MGYEYHGPDTLPTHFSAVPQGPFPPFVAPVSALQHLIYSQMAAFLVIGGSLLNRPPAERQFPDRSP